MKTSLRKRIACICFLFLINGYLSAAPPDVNVTVSGQLSCAGSSSVMISAASSVTGVTYNWTGPNGFVSGNPNPVVSTAGVYTVTATNPSTGETATASVTVSYSNLPATIWLEDFSGISNGATSDAGTTAWTATATGSGVYSVQNNEFKTTFDDEDKGTWTSQVINISGKNDVIISIDLRSECTASGKEFEEDDYIKLYYILDGRDEERYYKVEGGINGVDNGIARATITSPVLNGSTLRIVVKTKNSDDSEKYYFDNITVTAANAAGGIVNAAAGGAITCANAFVTLSGTSLQSGVSYHWTGPDNFSSNAQNPVVAAPGIYTVSISDAATACVDMDTVLVVADTAAPGINTGVSGQLACNGSSAVTLMASTSVAGASYSWTGPGGFVSNEPQPSVSAGGAYIVTVTNSDNGCSSSGLVNVTYNSLPVTVWLEDFSGLSNGATSDAGATAWSATASGSGVYSVQNKEFKTSFDDEEEGEWISQVINISGKKDVTVSIDLRSECTEDGKEFEDDDHIKLYYILDGGDDVRYFKDDKGLNGSDDGIESLTVTSPVLNGSTLQIVIKTQNSDESEIYYFDNIRVTAAADDIAGATVSGAITCANTSVQLYGNSGAGEANYNWTGPNGYVSTMQNPEAYQPGLYILTVSNPVTGCTGTDSVVVAIDTAAPGASAVANGILSCSDSTVTLTGSTTTGAVTYSWTGPGGFVSAEQNPVVSAPGTYTFTVTDTANGCSSAVTVPVTFSNTVSGTIWQEDFTGLSNGTTVDNGVTAWSASVNKSSMTFKVKNGKFKISDGNETAEGTWRSGSIDISGKTNVRISIDASSDVDDGAEMETSGSNMDYMRFYYQLNGGAEIMFAEKLGAINGHSNTATAISVSGLSGSTLRIVIRSRTTDDDEQYYFDNVQVTAATTVDLGVEAHVSGNITCINNEVELTGSTSAANAVYNWTGPNGYVSTMQNPPAYEAGLYILTVNGDGCYASDSVLVMADTVQPAAVLINMPGGISELTCSNTSLDLEGTSATGGVSWTWTGPDNFTATTARCTVTRGGSYSLKATDTANGCFTTVGTSIAENKTAPSGVSAFSSNALTCFQNTTGLSGTPNSTEVSYQWINPSGMLIANTRTITVSMAGTYTFVVSRTDNGCMDTALVSVTQNTTPPQNVTATNDGPLTCAVSEVTITGNSSTPGVDYYWTGPDDFFSFFNEEIVTAPGEYVLIVTDLSNGCADTVTTVVEEDYSACSNAARTVVQQQPVENITAEANGTAAFQYKAYPNPVRGNAVIEFTAVQSGRATVGIYNALGVCEKVLFNNNVSAGQLYRLSFNSNTLPAGVYYYMINVQGKRYAQKLLIAK